MDKYQYSEMRVLLLEELAEITEELRHESRNGIETDKLADFLASTVKNRLGNAKSDYRHSIEEKRRASEINSSIKPEF